MVKQVQHNALMVFLVKACFLYRFLRNYEKKILNIRFISVGKSESWNLHLDLTILIYFSRRMLQNIQRILHHVL